MGQARLLEERVLAQTGGAGHGAGRGPGRKAAVRSVTVNAAESPLGWLLARGHLSRLHYDAGERLRDDWERAQLSSRVTMAWDPAPAERGCGGPASASDPAAFRIDARRRFDGAIEAAGPGLADILWRVVCAGEGMREAESALGWPARAGKLVLVMALDRVAAFYRIS